MLVEIFKCEGNGLDFVKDKMNKFLKDNNITNIINVNVSISTLYELYQGQPPKVIYNWHEHIITLIYEKG